MHICNHLFYATDIDECELNSDQCDMLCDNTEGSYTCRCAAGALLQADGRSCSGENTHGQRGSDCVMCMYLPLVVHIQNVQSGTLWTCPILDPVVI